jgi:hypothetical protein
MKCKQRRSLKMEQKVIAIQTEKGEKSVADFISLVDHDFKENL